MNENLLRRIKSKLNAKCYVMNNAWLRDCVTFFVSGKAAHETTDRHIFEFVEGQWQLSDLREISNENGCLPKNLAQQVHTVLTGTYILQVDKMYDIASSKYKQLCEIRKVNSENIEVTEKETSQSTEYEPKARRMMQLCLTDGVQDVTAIEYKPLEKMTGTLLPGYKIMIIGPVTCRRGIILLEDGRYKEVGGEVESLLKLNALENVLARALGETENPDPYNDNGPSRAPNPQNGTQDSGGENSFFDDDFENTVDLEAVTVIERLSQENKIVGSASARDRPPAEEAGEPMEEFLEDIDFEPLENWPSDPPARSAPARRETERHDANDDAIMAERGSTSARDQRTPLPSLVASRAASEFPDDDFDFNDCEIVVAPEKSTVRQQQSGSSSRNEIESCFKPPLPKPPRPASRDPPVAVKKQIPVDASTTRSNSLMGTSSGTVRPSTSAPQLQKICDNLSDVLRESVTGKTYRTVRGQVKRHSALSKQGKCWAVTALIADSTTSVEVCFDSEILEQFLGFTVREFSQKKKLAKSDSRVNDELRQSLREAQHQIETLDALLRLELVQGQMPKVVGITRLTQQQKSLMKTPI